jgi:hypothetical protein
VVVVRFLYADCALPERGPYSLSHTSLPPTMSSAAHQRAGD